MEQVGRQWYDLYTQPRNEKKVAERLQAAGLEVYCPLVLTIRQWSDRKKKVKIPMFTSYVFAHVSLQEFETVRRDPGVLNFVYWLGKPAVVREEEIRAIKLLTQEGTNIIVESTEPKLGDRITILEGPFKGLTGFIEDNQEKRITLFIEQLGCRVKFNFPKLELKDNG